jgi:gas vesicle protein
MFFGLVIGLAAGVVAGWLGAPLAGKELRARAATSSGRRSLADSLKRRNQTLASAQQASAQARLKAENTAQGAADAVGDIASTARASVEDARQKAAEATTSALDRPRGLIERLQDRLDDARAAAREGYDQGVYDAERLYEDVRKGRDLE